MDKIVYSREISVNNDYDIIVAGGGPAGCAAAISAAQEGKKVLLIEATGCLGGMGTGGLVPSWAPSTDGIRIVYGTLEERILKECKKYLINDNPENFGWLPIDPERLKLIYDEFVTESGAEILFNTMISDVTVDGGGNVTAVIVSNKNGLSAYSAPMYIDCTGDGDIAAWAGAEFVKGDEDKGELQPATHCFTIGGVEQELFLTSPTLHENNKESKIYDIAKDEKYPLIIDTHVCQQLVNRDMVGFNAGHIFDVDNTDSISVSKALIHGRKLAFEFCDAIKEYEPDIYHDAFVAQTASVMGIRETRRIIGDYVLTRDDYIARKTFDDEIARNNYYIDVHLSREERELANAGKLNMDTRCCRYGKGESHGIPYRCLTPKKLKNVLVAGRIISCDRPVQGSVRVMPACIATGEAAGAAAALACDSGDIHEIDVSKLRTILLDRKNYIL